MKKVFVDTAYWVAIANPNDPWNKAAGEAHGRLGEVKLVTTQEVLGEFLTFLSKPQALRRAAVKMVESILKHPGVDVVPQSAESFEEGFKLYADRPDKEYSLQDCVSMNTMRSKKIEEILTRDEDFSREQFTILMKKDGP